MPVKKDLVGRVFGRLTVLSEADKAGGIRIKWLCRCECGNTATISGTSLVSGNCKSCGCIARELLIQRNKSHGHSGTPLYMVWKTMHQRCSNPNNKDYSDYGGRGIRVCRRWDKYENFLADMGDRPDGMTLDRRDNSKSYSKGNCRWVTMSRQNRNRRDTRMVTWNGKTQPLADWADELKISLQVLGDRLRRGWTVERAFTEVVVPFATREITYQGRTQGLADWARELGINYNKLHRRITKSGMSFEVAITYNRKSGGMDGS